MNLICARRLAGILFSIFLFCGCKPLESINKNSHEQLQAASSKEKKPASDQDEGVSRPVPVVGSLLTCKQSTPQEKAQCERAVQRERLALKSR